MEQELPVEDRTRYTPYESPLRFFKSYRYHPSFTQQVAGGFLSQTYSHQIDEMKPLCRFECGGGTCNDEHCGDQHWRDIEISRTYLSMPLSLGRRSLSFLLWIFSLCPHFNTPFRFAFVLTLTNPPRSR